MSAVTIDTGSVVIPSFKIVPYVRNYRHTHHSNEDQNKKWITVLFLVHQIQLISRKFSKSVTCRGKVFLNSVVFQKIHIQYH